MNEIRLLVADDDPDVRFAVTELLTEAGYAVEECADGMEAWRVFEYSPDRFAALITDLMMPGLTGDELVRRVRSIRPKLPIVIATSAIGDARLSELSTWRALEIVAKPAFLGELIQAVTAVVAEANEEAPDSESRGRSRASTDAGESALSPLPASRSRKLRSRRGLAGVAVAACIAAAVLVTSRLPKAPELPSSAESGITRGFVVEIDAPRGEISEKPRLLRWRAVSEARRYGVSLWRGADRLVFEARSEQSRIELPEDLLQSFDRGVTFRWSVRAFDSGGRVIADSGPITFRITPSFAD